jgi:hypothetical protein
VSNHHLKCLDGWVAPLKCLDGWVAPQLVIRIFDKSDVMVEESQAIKGIFGHLSIASAK